MLTTRARRTWWLRILISALLLAVLCLADTDTSKISKKRKGGPVEQTVFERGLIKEFVKYNSILQEHNKYHGNTVKRSFDGRVLAYMASKNKKAKERALRFRGKLTHVSPVWYDLVRNQTSGEYELLGTQHVDQEWIRAMRVPPQAELDPSQQCTAEEECPAPEMGSVPLIVPRVHVHLSAGDSFDWLDMGKDAVKILRKEARLQGYDGLVFEVWDRWQQFGIISKTKNLREQAFQWIELLIKAFHKVKTPAGGRMELILEVPPGKASLGGPLFEKVHFGTMAPFTPAFSLMTLDYSTPNSPGATHPRSWLRENFEELIPDPDLLALGVVGPVAKHLKPEKLLMGLAFYGNDFKLYKDGPGGDGMRENIGGKRIRELLKQYRPKIVWDALSEEHYFEYENEQEGREHKVYIPTLHGLAARVQQARELGYGLAISEMGKGMDYFYDLL